MIRLKFLGAGNFFTLKGYQTNMLITDTNSNFNLLIDCGTDIRFSLNKNGLSYRDITNIYISHLHGDHCGGLEYMGFNTFFDPSCDRPNLYIAAELVDQLWSMLEPSMGTLSDRHTTLETYFKVYALKSDFSYCLIPILQHSNSLIRLKIIPVSHFTLETLDITKRIAKTSYSLALTFSDCNVYFSMDCGRINTQYCEWSNLIIHDCETHEYKSGVHTHYSTLKKLPEHIRKKMLLVNYGDEILDTNGQILPEILQEGKTLFAGFATSGYEIAISN